MNKYTSIAASLKLDIMPFYEQDQKNFNKEVVIQDKKQINIRKIEIDNVVSAENFTHFCLVLAGIDRRTKV